MRRKRWLAAALVAITCLGLCACGKKTDPAASSSAPAETALPADMPDDFTFASGAGGWSTELFLEPDGSFTGMYFDSEMGDTDKDYPFGTVYFCVFAGRFDEIEKADEHSYTMKLGALSQETEEGEIEIDAEEGIRYISAAPYGLSEIGSTYRLYLPDTPLEGLSEEFLTWWPLRFEQGSTERKTLGCWGLLNDAEEYGFFSYEGEVYLDVPIPEDVEPLVTAAWGAEDRDTSYHTTIVRVSETASLQAGEKQHPGEDWGDGWLFSIARLDRLGLEHYLSYDDSNFDFFATDDVGAYYIFEHPSDVRLNRATQEEFSRAMEQWGALCEWADGIPAAVLEANPTLTPFTGEEYLSGQLRHEGEHRYVAYEDPDSETHANAMIFLSQPITQGEGGIWCVEGVQYLFTPGGDSYYVPVFPASMGHEKPSAEYYADLQAECDDGLHPELLKPEGALEEFVRTSESWMFDPDRDMSLFRFVEPEG